MKIRSCFKKIVFVFFLFLSISGLSACEKKEPFEQNRVYLFWQDGCVHCHDAIKHIQAKHPNVNIEMLNIKETSARKKLIQAVEQFNLSNKIGTPLFVMNNEILMGWSKETQIKFDSSSKKFQKIQ